MPSNASAPAATPAAVCSAPCRNPPPPPIPYGSSILRIRDRRVPPGSPEPASNPAAAAEEVAAEPEHHSAPADSPENSSHASAPDAAASAPSAPSPAVNCACACSSAYFCTRTVCARMYSASGFLPQSLLQHLFRVHVLLCQLRLLHAINQIADHFLFLGCHLSSFLLPTHYSSRRT